MHNNLKILIEKIRNSPKVMAAFKKHAEATKTLLKTMEDKPEVADRFFRELFGISTHKPKSIFRNGTY